MQAQARATVNAHIATALLHRGGAPPTPSSDPFADIPLAAAAAAAASAAHAALTAPHCRTSAANPPHCPCTAPVATSAVAAASAAAVAAAAEREAAALAAAAFARAAAATHCPALDGGLRAQQQAAAVEMQNNALGYACDEALSPPPSAMVPDAPGVAAANAAVSVDVSNRVSDGADVYMSPVSAEGKLLVAEYAATAPPPPLAGLASPFDACWCGLPRFFTESDIAGTSGNGMQLQEVVIFRLSCLF